MKAKSYKFEGMATREDLRLIPGPQKGLDFIVNADIWPQNQLGN